MILEVNKYNFSDSKVDGNTSKLAYLILATIFFGGTKHLFNISGVNFDILLLTGNFYLFFVLLLNKKLFFNKLILVFLFFYLILNFVIVFFNGYSIFLVFKIALPLLLVFFVTSSFFTLKNSQPKFFLLYLRFCFYSAVFGLFQYFLQFFGINLFVNVAGRLNSFFPEGSHYSHVILPAVIYYMLTKSLKFKALVLYAALILTFSSTAYLVLLVMIILFQITNIKRLLLMPIILAASFLIYENNDLINYRVNDLVGLNQIYDLNNSNLTTFSLFTNLEVAVDSALTNIPFGAGLGNHIEQFNKYYEQKNISFDQRRERSLGINKESGHSLVVRIISELGFVGLFLYILAFIRVLILSLKRFVGNNITEDVLILYSLSSILLFRFFKLGGYIDYGFVVFSCLIYCYYKKVKSN